ncbi:MAG TPA: LysM peptidoglycan-binding domain-containing protein [Anaerolineaceae bacterium]|nr:LysM peptidoglycan-binding domain-containing protein [Anaerolineaceae bacterium]
MKRICLMILSVIILASTLGAAPVYAQTACGSTYTVLRGDYLSKIARQCGISLTNLINANPQISNTNIIYPGQVLKIPSGTTPVTVTPGSTYIVQPGDTLNKIAVRFKVTVDSILKANPSITNANRIESGQQIKLPEGAVQIPTVSITPTKGDLGAKITLAATGFRANIPVEIAYGLTDTQLTAIQQATTDSHGAVLQTITLPAGAQAGKAYVFVVRSTGDANERATSNAFQVNAPSGTNQEYIVQRGDMLRSIASRFNTSVAAILVANPAITNPGLIYTGQKLTIPVGKTSPTVAITPVGGAAGTKIFVVAGGFPASQSVDIDLGIDGGTLTAVLDATTDSTGYLNKTVTIPSTAKVGEKWVVRVRTTNLTQAVEAKSNIFTVK